MALDAALTQVDPLLSESLQAEERQRQNWLCGWYLACGLSTVLAIVAATIVFNGSTSAADATTLTAKGWNLWQSGQLDSAEETFAEAVQVDEKSISAWNGLGWARLNQGKIETAEAAFTKCLELAPNHPAALNGMGQSAFARRDYPAAEIALLKAAPEANAAWYGLAKLYVLTGKYDQALPWIKKIIALEPNNELHKQLLAAAEAKSLPAELRTTIEPPGPEQAELLKGWQLHNAGQFLQGKEHFLKLKAKQPENPAVLNGLGFCMLNLGDFAGAQPEFEACLKLDPNAAGAMNGLARCLKANGKVDEAITWWKKLDELTPQANAGTYGLAMAYLEQGQHATALPYFERIAKESPNNVEVSKLLEACRQATQQ